MSEVFSKTGKGQEEIKTRAGGLSQRVRQVLIFIDGKRDIEALREMSPADDLTDMLWVLREQGYIEATELIAESASEPVAIVSTAPAEEPALTTSVDFRELPSTPATKELEMARNYMMNTLRNFTGPYAALGLLEKIHAAQSHVEMRAQFEHWIDAIAKAHAGKRRADELRRALLEVI